MEIECQYCWTWRMKILLLQVLLTVDVKYLGETLAGSPFEIYNWKLKVMIKRENCSNISLGTPCTECGISYSVSL